MFENCEDLQNHYAAAHPPSRRFVVKESAFQRKFVTYRYNFPPHQNEFVEAQKSLKNLIMRQIVSEAAQKLITRVSLIFIVEMIMEDHAGKQVTTAQMPFRASSFHANATNTRHIERMIRESFRQQAAHMEDLLRSGSNWRFSRALAFDMEISAVKPVRGGCNSISTRNWKNKRFLYSPENTDNKCFLYCIAYFLLFGLTTQQSVPPIEEYYKVKKRVLSFNVKGLQFPMEAKDASKFLTKNPNLDLSINILYRTKSDEVFPLEYKLGGGKYTATLLLTETESGGHFLLVKNPDLYLRQVYRKGLISYQKTFFCLNCFSSFNSSRTKEEHSELCMMNKPRIEKTPTDNNWISFRNYERKHWLDYIAYLDFECVLPNSKQKCDICSSLKCKCDQSGTSGTSIINEQRPICYSFVILDKHNNVIHERTYAGVDAHLDFMNHLLEQEELWIKGMLETKINLDMTFRDTSKFNNATDCYICRKTFDETVAKCRDHCHFSGKYLGAACQPCNLRRRRPNTLKIFIHNASKYDMHFIIKSIPEFRQKIEYIGVLPYNGENFRTLRLNSFEIMDSLAFLQASLGQLAADLKLSNHSYKILRQTYLVREKGHFCKKKLEMVLSKSFFPYEYCTSYEKMANTTSLPKLKRFYSKLSEQSISMEDHKFAKQVWKEYKCGNLIDYCKLYCKIDVILLAEIFQKFRKEMMAFSSLDPAHYISLPAYGYDSMLLITGARLELPTDINMVHFIEKGKRGGVSFINNRHLYTEKEETEETEERNLQTDAQKEEIVYIDANNLYGLSQIQKLPIDSFRWLSKEEVKNFSLTDDFEGEKGYFVECDLKYPTHLHKLHSNYPLAPEILEVNFENLSPYAQTAIEKTDGKRKYKDVKLMSTFHDRIKYVCHVKNLCLYVSLGLELTKIHRVLEFRQEAMFKPFIEKTTTARQNAKSKFETDLFKKLVSQNNFTIFQRNHLPAPRLGKFQIGHFVSHIL